MTKLVDQFIRMLQYSLEPDGVPNMPGIIQGQDLEIAMYAAIDPYVMLDGIQRRCCRGDVVEFVCGLDTRMREGQGATMDSGVVIFHARRGKPTRVGLWEYEGDEYKPVTWENEFWNAAYAELGETMARWVGAI